MNREAICLLDIDLPSCDCAERETIELEVNGERVWREFEVVKVFSCAGEAIAYALENDITDMIL